MKEKIERPDAKWVLVTVINIKIFVSLLPNIPIDGGVKLPSFIVNNKGLHALVKYRNGRDYWTTYAWFVAWLDLTGNHFNVANAQPKRNFISTVMYGNETQTNFPVLLCVNWSTLKTFLKLTLWCMRSSETIELLKQAWCSWVVQSTKERCMWICTNHTSVTFANFLNVVNCASAHAAVSFGLPNIFTVMCVLAMLKWNTPMLAVFTITKNCVWPNGAAWYYRTAWRSFLPVS